MSTSASNLGNNARLAASALDARLSNIRANMPPSLRSACLPESTSAFLRNVLLASVVLNGLLFPSTLLAAGARFMGFSIVLVSLASCIHVLFAGAVLGNHAADAVSALGATRAANTLRNGAARFGMDPYAHGALFGATLAMGVLLHVVSTYYGGVAQCATAMSKASVHHNLTGGYKTFDEGVRGTASSNMYGECGASGPVGFVSFLSGLLFWLDVALAAALYARREELLSGVMASGQMYDEIGVVDENGAGGGGFAGDFPSSSGPQTMNV